MADDAEISALLRGLGPDAEPDAVMPADVWSRIQGVLAAESAARIATSGGPQTPATHHPRSANARRTGRPSYARRWATGLVAASAVVLAGVVLAGVLREDEAPIVAGSDVLQAPQALAAAGVLSPNSIIAPAQRITHSETDYSRDDFPAQVDELLVDTGMDARMDTVAKSAQPMALEVSPLLAAPLQKLRACVTDILDSEQRSALIVDLSTFEGQPVGILLTPTSAPGWMQATVVDTDCHLAYRSVITVP